MPISYTEHAKARLWQRYGLLATPGLTWFLARAIEDLCPPDDCVSVLSVPYRDRNLRFVFDGRHRDIITFLPELERRASPVLK